MRPFLNGLIVHALKAYFKRLLRATTFSVGSTLRCYTRLLVPDGIFFDPIEQDSHSDVKAPLLPVRGVVISGKYS